MTRLFAKETELVAAFCQWLTFPEWEGAFVPGAGWTAYHETAGWDLLLSHGETGMQVGIEAKLSLNAKVLSQALPPNRYAADTGPDYRAVLVPDDSCQHHMQELSRHLGVTVIKIRDARYDGAADPKWRASINYLPKQTGESYTDRDWVSWLPTQRAPLPDYVPDVVGGDASPLALTQWKIKAIKLMILLERRGAVHRSDMKALQISPTRWTDRYYGFLAPTESGYVKSTRTPDLRAQHPVNWAEIEADFDTWNPYAKWEQAA